MIQKSNRNFLEDLGDELALALGNAVWAFALIEWITFEYMKQLSQDDLHLLMGDTNFGMRVSIIKKLVERCQVEDKIKKDAIESLSKAKDLADRRNIIVHNPWQIWIDFDRKDFMTELQKYMVPEKKLDLDQIHEFVVEAKALEADLKTALDALKRAV